MTCADCGTGTWTGTPVPGLVRRQGRGLCVNCYESHRRHGTLDQFPRRVWGTGARRRPCSRCGVDTTTDLCRDCRDVQAA